jgi:hypothetical protein
MPQISPAQFCALPLRVHMFLADVSLHDVWAVDLPGYRDGVSLSEFLRRASHDSPKRLPPAARALLRLRLFLGRIFRFEAEPNDAAAASFGRRLAPEDRARSSVVSGTQEGLFRVVYRFENEQLLEIQNRTGHAAALSALVGKPRWLSTLLCRLRAPENVGYAVLPGLDRSVPKTDYLSGPAENHSRNLGSAVASWHVTAGLVRL